MNSKKKLYGSATLLSMLLLFGCAADDDGAASDSSEMTESSSEQDESMMEEMFTYAIQDEHLAHGEYAYTLETFGDQAPFNNIVSAEAQHIAEMTVLFEKYGLPVPADESADHLQRPADIKEALENCATGEVDNIAMYHKFLEQEIPDDVRATFTALRNASEGHLQSFQKSLEKY